MSSIFRFFLLGCFTINIYAFDGILPYETTQLKSQSGAGVASLLTNEATFFNPASIVFTNQSTFLYGRNSIELEDKSDLRDRDYKEGLTESFILVDSSTSLKGGFNYIYQNQATGKKRSYNLSMAAPISKRSAAGFVISHNEEDSLLYRNKIYTQIDFGYTQVIKEGLTYGFVVDDITFVNSEYFKYTAGIFYSFNKFVDLIADVGSGDMLNRDKKSFNKWALQIQAHDGVFLRYGRFYDRSLGFKGSSYGVTWVGPKLVLDYAIKNSEKISEDSDIVFKEEQFIENSLALTVLF
ncbi:MAG: hypothetical protein VYA54_05810 [Bdellovibrionota bacterium]|nr:hypothetical protein [Bdellovibrionota bacterium]